MSTRLLIPLALLSLGLFAWFIITPQEQFVSATGGTFVRGDADGSGSVTYSADFDYVLAYLFSSGPDPDPFDAGDANDDGDVTVADASYLANYDSGGPAPPAPFSIAGYDPTPDPLVPEDDANLTGYDSSLTSYLASSASALQDIRPLAIQRGVSLDGRLRAPATVPFHAAGNPFEPTLMRGEVITEASGTYTILDTDMALPATGFSWVIGRTYNARQETSGSTARNSDGYQGVNWFQTSQPEIVLHEAGSDSEDVLYLIYGADRYLEFKRLDDPGTSDTFRGVNGTAGAVVFTSGGASVPDTYTYTDQNSYEHTFFGFDGDAGSAAGQYWKTEDPAGNVAFVGDETDPADAITNGYDSGRIEFAYDTSDRRYTYDYTSLDSTYRLTEVLAETKTGGAWDGTPTGLSEVSKVEYTYYSDESYGDTGDLETVTITTPLTDSGQSLVQTKYYRYYENEDGAYHATNNPGYPHALKYIIGFEGCRNYDYNEAGDSSFDDDFLTALESEIDDFADAYFEYDTSHRIKKTWMRGACGCAGGINGTHEFTYATNGTDTDGYNEDEWRYRTVVERPDGGWTTLYFDEVAQATARVVTDADPSGSPTKTWCTVLDRDADGRVDLLQTPANITAYTHSTGSFTASTSIGLVHHYERETVPPVTGYWNEKTWSEGTGGSAYLDGSQDYTYPNLTVGDTVVSRGFVSSWREYTEEWTSGTTGSNLYSVSTTVHSGTLMPSTVTVTVPAVSASKNGEALTSTRKTYFTAAGESTFDKSTDGIITYRAYTNGQLTTLTEDADTTSLSPPTGFGSSGTEIDWTTTYTYDAQGRATETALPTGLDKELYYSQLKDRRIVRLAYNDVSGSTYYGPVQYSVSNHAGQAEVTSTIGLPSNSSTTAQSAHIDETTDDPLLAVNGSWSVGRMRVSLYNDSGNRRTEERVYFSTPGSGAGTDGLHYDATTYGYDDTGRQWRVKEPHGTITRTVFDLNGNMTERWIGTNDYSFVGGETSGTDNMVQTVENEYDGGNDGGNQYLTKTTLIVDHQTANDRISTYTNDVRGRRLLEARPESPHFLHKYDNLGRRIATGTFSSTSNITVGTTDPTSSGTLTDRIGLTQTFHDERGRVWKTQQHMIDDSDGSDDDELEHLRWYNRDGRLAKSDGPQLEKVLYDRLGRETHRYTLASDNDSGYADILTVAGDTVLVETQRVYDSVGDVILQCRIDREHDDMGTGALDSNGDIDDLKYTAGNLSGRIQITANWYDSLTRLEDVVIYGTYGGSDFDRDALSVPTRSATALRTTYTYNTMGDTETRKDPRDITYYTGYDDAGRVTSQVRNASATPPGAPSGTDTNQTVLYEYTDGLLTTLTADMPGANDQDTIYTYGTTKGTGTGESRITTKHLLHTIQYPDSSGGSDVVEQEYNAQGELIWKTDQGGNEIEYVYDDAGRVEARIVRTVGTGFDGAIRRIGTTYTPRGQVEEVTQYSDTSGSTVVDQVEYEYDDWGLVTKFAQDHDSAITGSGDYYYKFESSWEKATGGRNTIRRDGMTLPSGTSITIDYATGIDANASRVSGLKESTTSLVTYDYNGFAHLVGIQYPQIDVYREYYDTTYDDLDRFNRITHLQWIRDLVGSRDADDLAEFVDLEYAYDENHNPTRVVDNVHVYSGTHAFDTLYTYDDLNRLTSAEQGNWTGSAINNDTEYRGWVLDHAGNWTTEQLDLNGDGLYTATDEYNDTRTHNDANEITDLHGKTPVYDDNGNLTDDKNDYEYEYDSFNRLRKVKSQSSNLLSEYKYNGLGYLIAVHNDADDDGDVDVNDPWYHYVYDERWRRITTYRETDTSPKMENLHHEHGPGETNQLNDALVLRDRDASTDWEDAANAFDETLYYCHNWRGDVVALVGSGGEIVEHAKYSPYGTPYGIPGGDTDGDFDADSTDDDQIQDWIDASTYDILGDLDLDDEVDSADRTVFGFYPYTGGSSTLGRGALSSRRNAKGYSGYAGDQRLSKLSHVRFRVLSSELGRWLQRDPLGYIDSISVYPYTTSRPIASKDSLGLLCNVDMPDPPDEFNGATAVGVTDPLQFPQFPWTDEVADCDTWKQSCQALGYVSADCTCVCDNVRFLADMARYINWIYVTGTIVNYQELLADILEIMPGAIGGAVSGGLVGDLYEQMRELTGGPQQGGPLDPGSPSDPNSNDGADVYVVRQLARIATLAYAAGAYVGALSTFGETQDFLNRKWTSSTHRLWDDVQSRILPSCCTMDPSYWSPVLPPNGGY